MELKLDEVLTDNHEADILVLWWYHAITSSGLQNWTQLCLLFQTMNIKEEKIKRPHNRKKLKSNFWIKANFADEELA